MRAYWFSGVEGGVIGRLVPPTSELWVIHVVRLLQLNFSFRYSVPKSCPCHQGKLRELALLLNIKLRRARPRGLHSRQSVIRRTLEFSSGQDSHAD